MIPPTYKILVVEDDRKIATLLKDYLEQDGYKVTMLHRGDEVVPEIRANPADLILLDILLPGEDGLTVFTKVRAVSNVPVLFLTAKVEDADRLMGFELGADDYICKPFLPREVVARVRAVLRRTYARQVEEKLEAGPIAINTTSHKATVSNSDLQLTPIEFELLKLLASRPGQVFTRSDLIETVQGGSFEGYDRTIDSHISNLRKKISKHIPAQKIIHTVYGIGYSFSVPRKNG
jgi:two-component system response regulator BaeR